jgi:hypothetical protein
VSKGTSAAVALFAVFALVGFAWEPRDRLASFLLLVRAITARLSDTSATV